MGTSHRKKDTRQREKQNKQQQESGKTTNTRNV